MDTAHAYLATTAFAALLESALHEAAVAGGHIYRWQLDQWIEGCVRLSDDLRLVDLRDGELARLGLDRSELVATDAVHHPCTRAWAEAVHGRAIGGQVTSGMVWNSRQAELRSAALADRPALAELVTDFPAQVAVLWSPPADASILAPVPGGLGPLDEPKGTRYIDDLVATLGIVVE